MKRMRLDALLSRFGYCSRREAPAWIKQGRVLVDGVAASSPSARVDPVRVRIDGEPVDAPGGLYAAFHKPAGYTCSHSRDEGELVYDLLPPRWLLRHPPVTTVGRLDKETTGLLLLTDDGAFVHRHTSPKRRIPKTYVFTTEADIPADAPTLFASGTLLLGGETTPCLPAGLTIVSPREGRLVIHEGRYHQVRRMMAAVGAPVATLERTAIGNLTLASLGLEAGAWTLIDPACID